MGPGMGQVGMTEARGGRVEFPAEGLAGRKPVQSEQGQESKRGWEAAMKKKLFAEIHTLMPACYCSLGSSPSLLPKVSNNLCQARIRGCFLHSVHSHKKLGVGQDGKTWALAKARIC